MGLVEQRTLRFAGLSTDGSAIACGVPGPAVYGGALTNARDKATLASLIQTAQQSYVRLDFGRSGHNMGPVNAIGISPDSAIHSCDIALAGRDGEVERRRVSPGNPLVGCLSDYDFAMVSLPNSIPSISNALGNTVAFWDGDPSAPISGGALAASWPLRLELWRGSIVPIRAHKRAAYIAHYFVNSAADTDTSDLYVCVDGRRRIDVTIYQDLGTVTVTMFGIEARKSSIPKLDATIAVPLALDGVGTLSAAVVGGVGQAQATLSFDGNPITILQIHLAQSVAVGRTQIHLKAYD